MNRCQLCDGYTPATHDAKLTSGPWAYVCADHFESDAVAAPGTFTTLANIGTPGREPYSD